MHRRGIQHICPSSPISYLKCRYSTDTSSSPRGVPTTRRQPLALQTKPPSFPEHKADLRTLSNDLIQNIKPTSATVKSSRGRRPGQISNSDVAKHGSLRASAWKPVPPVRISSQEKEAFFASREEGLEDEEQSVQDKQIPPGSFVEIRRNARTMHGVILRHSSFFLKAAISVLVSTGEVWEHIMASDVMYIVPDFADQATVMRCGTGSAATDEREIHARISVLKKLKEFEKVVENKMPHIGQRLAPSLKWLDEREPEAWAKITLGQVAKDILATNAAPPSTLICIHKWLMSHPEKFLADPTEYVRTQSFAVRPVNEQRDIEFAVRAIHRNDPCVDEFVEKAKLLIAASRSRQYSMTEEPSVVADKSVSFTDTDRIFIRFLAHALHTARTIQKNPLVVPTSVLVKKTGMYEQDRIESDVVHRMLREIGALPPWDDLLQRDVQFILDADPGVGSTPVPRQKLGPDQFYPRDIVEDLRHDFGDSQVYVVDDYDAAELDDGLSVEDIPSEPGKHWLHVHIADPTLLLHPAHRYSEHARRVLQTSYYVYGSNPMIPKDVVHNGLSLGSGQGPTCVMTFSAKIDENGDIVDYRVRPGIVRNVNVLRYDDVDKALGNSKSAVQYPFGRLVKPPSRPVPKSYMKDLRALYSIATRTQASRIRRGSVVFSLSKASPSMASALPSTETSWKHPAVFRGFPAIEFGVESEDHADRGAHMMIAECMKAASRVASRFFRDTGVPAVRRTGGQLFLSENNLAELQAMRNDIGFVSFFEVARREGVIPRAEYTLETKGHWQLGIPDGEGYVRVTSPLRRYGDMLAHWQIKQALLAPRTGQKPWLFSEDWLKQLIPDMGTREYRQNAGGKMHHKFWALKGLQAVMDNPSEAAQEILGSLIAHPVGTSRKDKISGHSIVKVAIPILGLTGDMRVHDEVEIGEPCRAKISHIRFGLRPQLELQKL